MKTIALLAGILFLTGCATTSPNHCSGTFSKMAPAAKGTKISKK